MCRMQSRTGGSSSARGSCSMASRPERASAQPLYFECCRTLRACCVPHVVACCMVCATRHATWRPLTPYLTPSRAEVLCGSIPFQRIPFLPRQIASSRARTRTHRHAHACTRSHTTTATREVKHTTLGPSCYSSGRSAPSQCPAWGWAESTYLRHSNGERVLQHTRDAKVAEHRLVLHQEHVCRLPRPMKHGARPVSYSNVVLYVVHVVLRCKERARCVAPTK